MRSTATDPFIDHLHELLAPLGPISTRRMFGGWGIYCGEYFFALVADDRLYLKADADNEAAFRDAGCSPFVYVAKSKSIALHYWSVPDEALDSADAMMPWARRGLDAAKRAAARKSQSTPRRRSSHT